MAKAVQDIFLADIGLTMVIGAVGLLSYWVGDYWVISEA